MPDERKRRIVILGGGFGGCFAAQRLERLFKGDPTVELSLVNRENYFVFQPLLPEVASGAIAPHQIVNPLRRMLRRTRFYPSEIEAVDLAGREVSILVGEGRRLHRLPYDQLILALGTVVDLTGLPGLAQHSLPMKTLGDAFYLRNHVIGCLEHADFEPDPVLRRELLSFVVVGGGFSGVETVGELQELVSAVLPSYPTIREDEIHFTLVQSGDRLLPEVGLALADYARERLAARGIEVLLNQRCAAATPDCVRLTSGQRIATRTLVSTVGNAPHPLISHLPCPQEKGRIVTDECLAVPGFPGVWALGDCAAIPHGEGHRCAPTAQNAIRQASRCAENVARSLRGEIPLPFRFNPLGKLASIGRRSAVAELFGLRFSGFLAWFVWRLVYLLKLPGWERRLRVAIDWTLDLFFKRDLTQLKVFRTERMEQAHYEPGEAIVRQGEIGDRFYVIVKGQVEVRREEAGTEQHLATLGQGEHFGEVALLQDVPRTASVIATQPTDVFCIGRGDFEQVARHFSLLRQGLASPAQSPPAEVPPDQRAAS